MTWIFLSPHLDDAVLSCGGLIAELVRQGQIVEVWTICAGDPPPGPLSPLVQSLHQRWETPENPVEIRRREDHQACGLLDAGFRHFPIPDCIYRRNPVTGEPLIRENKELFQLLPEVEWPLAEDLRQHLKASLPADARVVSPLTLGGHIDHHLVRRAAEGLNRRLLWYADYPYAIRSSEDRTQWLQTSWVSFDFPIRSESLSKWKAAIAAYQSQISTFWRSTAEMEASIEEYWLSGGGSQLWGEPAADLHNKSAN